MTDSTLEKVFQKTLIIIASFLWYKLGSWIAPTPASISSWNQNVYLSCRLLFIYYIFYWLFATSMVAKPVLLGLVWTVDDWAINFKGFVWMKLFKLMLPHISRKIIVHNLPIFLYIDIFSACVFFCFCFCFFSVFCVGTSVFLYFVFQ